MRFARGKQLLGDPQVELLGVAAEERERLQQFHRRRPVGACRQVAVERRTDFRVGRDVVGAVIEL